MIKAVLVKFRVYIHEAHPLASPTILAISVCLAPVAARSHSIDQTPLSHQPVQSSTQSDYDSAMKAGYTAVQNRNYKIALENFRKALELRPQDTFALKAIQNVKGYIERQQAQAVDSNYDRFMRIGYAAAQKRDYQTALINFRRALQARPEDTYALQGIQNVSSYISRARPAAPWSNPPLSENEVPPVLLAQWRQAENRSTCAALAPKDLGKYSNAQPRSAYFAGGWAIAYDQPGLPGRNPGGSFCPNCGRGTFGIAGAGVEANSSLDIPRWANQKAWADGSRAGYGLEGDIGPQYLAYVTIKGQRCLYNVWSFLGKEHLEALLQKLQFVNGAP